MDYHELKNLMRKYLGDNVDSEELRHLFVDRIKKMFIWNLTKHLLIK